MTETDGTPAQGLKSFLWLSLGICLALGLVWRGWGAHRQNVVLQKRLADEDALVERLRMEQRRLREETDALKHDPTLIEKELRREQPPLRSGQ